MGNDHSSPPSSSRQRKTASSNSTTTSASAKLTIRSSADRSSSQGSESSPSSQKSRQQSKELVLENAFHRKVRFQPYFDHDIHLDDHFDNRPHLSRSLTFDERKLLSHQPKGFDGLPLEKPMMKRAVTFVNRNNFEVKRAVNLEDVMFRRHFSSKELIPKFGKATLKASPSSSDVYNNQKIVVVVDAFASGLFVAYQYYLRGYNVINLLSREVSITRGSDAGQFTFLTEITFSRKLDSSLALDQVKQAIVTYNMPVVAIVLGYPTGADICNQLSLNFNLEPVCVNSILATRNKHLIGDLIRKSGLLTPKQHASTTWTDIETFFNFWKPDPFQIVVKPLDSIGTDDVYLCDCLDAVKVAYGNIIGKLNSLGLENKGVLLQEFVSGQEYVVDIVCSGEICKVVALWKIKKQPCNGFQFIFQSAEICLDINLLAISLQTASSLCSLFQVKRGPCSAKFVVGSNNQITILNFNLGCYASHSDLIHLSEKVLGTSHVDASCDCYTDESAFSRLPSIPKSRDLNGSILYFRSTKSGVVKDVNAIILNKIIELSTYNEHQLFFGVGEKIKRTKNNFSIVGCVTFVSSDGAAINNDIESCQTFEETLLEVIESPDERKNGIAVVDPFSTGASLAAHIYQLGYKVVAVYSANMEQLATMKNLIPQGLNLSFETIVPFDGSVADVANTLRNLPFSIIEVMVGAETGVALADSLSEFMGLTSNGTDKSEARRNKYYMGETIRAAGVRAMQQLRSSQWEEVETFVNEWNPDPFFVVVKPLDSAGSEDVTLCHSLTEVKTAFDTIIGKVNGLGLVNNAVLVQEFLDGTEYVVDMVTRNSHHKCVALWRVDKRPVNGAPFVLYGYEPLVVDDDPHCRVLIEYQKSVLTALGIKWGPSHGELRWNKNGPILVEVGARCHGGEGTWVGVSNAVYGYNQVEAALASFIFPAIFEALPEEPSKRVGNGRLVCLVCKVSGNLKEINPDLIEEIRHMPSFLSMEIFLKPGDFIRKTINCFNLAGVIILTHASDEHVKQDYNRIREIEDLNLFICE